MERTAPPIPDDVPRSFHRPRLVARSSRDRVLTGVAGGIGERLGVDPTVVRLGFVALSLAAGIGVVLYLMAWLLSSAPTAPSAPPHTSARQAAALGLIGLGVLVLLRQTGLWFGDRFVWPVVLVAAGSAVIWTRSDEGNGVRWAHLMGRLPERWRGAAAVAAPRVRTFAGLLLIVAGVGRFLTANNPQGLSLNAPLMVAATFVAIAVIAGPLFWRLGRQLTEERRQRIRSQERAEVAAHLHDSVLQTLALIQRSEEPRQMATLARSQERELRSWLYGGARAADHTLISTAMNDAAAEVERVHRITIDVVTVGECRLNEPSGALVLAAREAMVNSAAHSGSDRVSVYVEAADGVVTAYVRDQGRGFDPKSVPPDRRGIADSIAGRMARYGGETSIASTPGSGTEVRLQVTAR
ncbi:MAG: PspC domain-containing protein [Actinomycetota bacterium]|nr:PspC domain-containing protein [Actinomycetota bacterium]